MSDTTVKKVSSAHSPRGAMRQKYLVSGVSLAMRLWEDEPPGAEETLHTRDYETVGFVINGRIAPRGTDNPARARRLLACTPRRQPFVHDS